MTDAESPAAPVTMRGRGADAESLRWLAVLGEDAPAREEGIADLHGLLVRDARAEVHRRGRNRPDGFRRTVVNV